MSLITKARIEFEDYLRWHPATRHLLHRRALCKALWRDSQGASAILHSVDRLCAATRLAPSSKTMQHADELILECIRPLDVSEVDWREFVPYVERRRIEKAVLLKPRIGPAEKGVVFVSFEE